MDSAEGVGDVEPDNHPGLTTRPDAGGQARSGGGSGGPAGSGGGADLPAQAGGGADPAAGAGGADGYPQLVARLAARHDRVAAERAEVIDWYDQQCEQAARAVRAAQAALHQAEQRERAARRIAEASSLRAHQLWRALEDLVGSIGRPPEQAMAADPADDPDELLHRVQQRLERSSRGPAALPSWASPLLVVFGVVAAGVGFAAAQAARLAARHAGGDFEVFAPVLRQILILLAPFLGLVPARLLAERRGARLDAGSAGVVVIAGLLTVGVAFALSGW